jgi:hypothetical protein
MFVVCIVTSVQFRAYFVFWKEVAMPRTSAEGHDIGVELDGRVITWREGRFYEENGAEVRDVDICDRATRAIQTFLFANMLPQP